MNAQLIIDNIQIFIALLLEFITIFISVTANLDKIEKSIKNHKNFFGIFLSALITYLGVLMIFFMIIPFYAPLDDNIRYERWYIFKLLLSIIEFLIIVVLYGGKKPILIQNLEKTHKLRNYLFRFLGYLLTMETIWLFFDSMMNLLSFRNN